jgi:predicted anti-sigma-YlaC factor YlaD
MSEYTDQPADDLDAEFARLLGQRHDVEAVDVRAHLKTCPCCATIATLLGNLRRDLHDLAEGRVR